MLPSRAVPLKYPIKIYRVTERIEKQDPSIGCLQETHFIPKYLDRLKVKGWKKIFNATNREKKAGVAVPLSDKIDFKTKKVTGHKGHYIMIMWAVQQEDITIINIYAPNTEAPTYVKLNKCCSVALTCFSHNHAEPLLSAQVSPRAYLRRALLLALETRTTGGDPRHHETLIQLSLK